MNADDDRGSDAAGVTSSLPCGMTLRGRPGLSDAQRLVEARFIRQIRRDPLGVLGAYRQRFGVVANSDLAKELAEGLFVTREQRTLHSRALHLPSQELARAAFRQILAAPVPAGARPLAVFTAGGTGSGKTTGLGTPADVVGGANVVYDSTLANLEQAAEDVEAALSAGRRVVVVFTLRDVADAFTHGVLPRAMSDGRTVSIESHLRTHIQAPRTVLALAEQYRSDGRVSGVVVRNRTGEPRSVERSGWSALHALRYDEAQVRRTLREALEAEFDGGRITALVAEATRAGGALGIGRSTLARATGPPKCALSAGGPWRHRGARGIYVATLKSGPPSGAQALVSSAACLSNSECGASTGNSSESPPFRWIWSPGSRTFSRRTLASPIPTGW